MEKADKPGMAKLLQGIKRDQAFLSKTDSKN